MKYLWVMLVLILFTVGFYLGAWHGEALAERRHVKEKWEFANNLLFSRGVKCESVAKSKR